MSENPFLIQAENAQRQASDPRASVWVSASAGTGKTKVLTDRVLGLLLDGVRPDRILCLTFTKAAATEMSSRIAERLAAWTTVEDDALSEDVGKLTGLQPDEARLDRARRLFVRVLDTPGGMHIQTIHAFCQSLLRRFPLEAGVPPHFTVMDDRDAAEMLANAQEAVLEKGRKGRDERLAEALTVVTSHLHESGFPDLMLALTRERGRIKRLLERFGDADALSDAVKALLGVEGNETLETLITRACREETFDGPGLRYAAEALVNGSKTDIARGQTLADWLAAPQEDRVAQFDAYANAFLTKGKPRKTLITKGAAAEAPRAPEVLEAEALRLEALEERKKAVVTAQATAALLLLAEALLAEYETRKSRRAAVDYDDLILTACTLLDRPGVAPWVLYKLDGGLEHVLVDEAQDTNPDQWRVVEALAGEFFVGCGTHEGQRTVFAVGDAKQSIYSFQRADPAEFERMRAMFAEAVPTGGERWREVPLTVSFRSTAAVLKVVDEVFAPGRAAEGVTLDGSAVRHQAWRVGQAGLVEVWPPVSPRGGEEQAPWKPPVEPLAVDAPQTRLAGLVARKIAALTDGSEILPSRGTAVTPGDILILVRRRTGFVEDLVRELKQRDIAVAGVDRMVLTAQIAVMDLVALGRFLLLPEDDLTTATVLKGPFVGLSEEQLFTLAYQRGGTLFTSLRERVRENAAFATANDFLRDLLAKTDRLAPFELFSYVLNGHGGWRKLLARLGPDAEDPVNEFLDLSLAYEQSHAPTLEGFLYWFERGEAEVKRDLDQGDGGAVRIMTVHGAKGLQAPIVFLPDTLQKPQNKYDLLWPKSIDGGELPLWPPKAAFREVVCEAQSELRKTLAEQEYRRLLYVAMTRAEDRLYVCGWRTKKEPPEGNWHSLIWQGLSELATEEEDPFLAAAKETDGTMVLRYQRDQEVRPSQGEGGQTTAPLMTDLPLWATRPPPPEPVPSTPLSPSRPDEEPAVSSPLAKDDGARFLRGRLVHRLLEILPAMPYSQQKRAALRWLAGTAPNLSENECSTLVDEVSSILNSPDFQVLFGPASRAEVPIVGELEGRVVSGRIDRLAVLDEEVVVVDYKTNRPPPQTVDEVMPVYLRQMAIYRDLIQLIYPTKRVRCMLLWTDGPRLMEIPSALLSDSTT